MMITENGANIDNNVSTNVKSEDKYNKFEQQLITIGDAFFVRCIKKLGNRKPDMLYFKKKKYIDIYKGWCLKNGWC